MNSKLTAVLTTATIAATGAATAQSAQAASYLQTPTGNIVCRTANLAYGPSLSCDVKSAGVSYNVDRRGRAWVGRYRGFGYGRVASYDWVYRSLGFTCVSRTSGLRCIAPSGHGFFLSRERRYRF